MLSPLGSGSLLADGAEQTVLEFSEVGRVMGYIDLWNMQEGDQVIIRQYMRVVEGGEYRLYAQEIYANVQAVPVVYVTPKETDFGIAITLQQTSAPVSFKSFDYNLLGEK